MKKTKKNNKTGGRKSGHPSFRGNTYWRRNSPPRDGEAMGQEAGSEYREDEELEDEAEERRWERDAGDDEPGEAP